MKKRLQISVIGELAVLQNNVESVLPPSKKTRALLAYLAVVNRRQRRDHLCKMFWELPDDPRASLRWSLSKIRKLVNLDGQEECLITDRSSVFLDTSKLDVDFLKVAQVTEKALLALGTPNLEELAAQLKGQVLDGLDLPSCPMFEAWRVFHSDKLDRTKSLILHTLAERLRSHPDRAHEFEQVLASLDPTDEIVSQELQSFNTLAGTIASLQKLEAEGSDRQLSNNNDFSETETARKSLDINQEIRFCKSPDGVQIAYATSGNGPPILRAAHWMSHLQYDWESPVWQHWISELSHQNTLIRYDQRGNGLSDWVVSDLSCDAMVADLESVADACDLRRFPLLGVSQSCGVSVAYAVRHPERVSHLILYGGFEKGWRKRGNIHEIRTHEAMTTLILEGWGKKNPAFRQLFTETFIPEATREQMNWFNELQKETVSPENASRLNCAFGDTDVSELLDRVNVPTLVLHARSDGVAPFDQGKVLAAGIRGARFVDLNSKNHILLKDEPAFAEFIREVRYFISTPVSA